MLKKLRFDDFKPKVKAYVKRFGNLSLATKVITLVSTCAVCSVIIYLTVLAFQFFGGVGRSVSGVIDVGKQAIGEVVDAGRVAGVEIKLASKPAILNFHKIVVDLYQKYKPVKPIFVEYMFGSAAPPDEDILNIVNT